jgi:acetyl-CoA C-acetyltransferase
MNKVYIVSAKRTAIGSFLGTLSNTHASILGATVVKDILTSTGVNPVDIDEVLVGNVLPAGAGQGLARQVSVKGGIPASVPAYGVHMVCGSGMKTIMNGYTSIKAGMHKLVIAGGVESMSNAPFTTGKNIRLGNKMGDFKLRDHIVYDALTDAFNNYHMGVTAENIAEKHSISREEQDAFALNSQIKAIDAVDNGRFKDEIVPLEIKTRKETITFDTDEYPNRRTNAEKLSKLRAVFKEGGSVTAGNASGINDGASFVMLANEEMIEKYNLTPLAEIVAVGQGGVDPSVMGLGPVPAIDNCLGDEYKLSQMGLIELNEAFAAQSIGVIKELAIDHDLSYDEILRRTNVNGGAIALGHPVGVSGNRIVVTLLHEMKRRKVDYGLASLCIGGGMGTAVVIKNM